MEHAIRPGSALTVRQTLELFTFQLESRVLDLLARELKREGASYYTIGSAGHEGNACVAAALNTDDMAFLHYRSGAFFCARAGLTPGPEGPFDVLLGIVASSDEPIAGGRHKVFGSVPLCIPPQTSTIASHLPKALGYAVALDRKARIDEREETRIAVCTFGDASLNHATAQSAMHSAAWASFQNVPAPVLFVCEDNGFGISVRTPRNWVASSYTDRAGLKLFRSNGLDLVEAYDTAQAAADYVRTHRKPALLHMSVVRLLGHAGSDVERLYREQSEIEATEAMDPLIRSADILMDEGGLSAEALLSLYQSIRTRLGALAQEATVRDKITTREEIMVPLAPKNPQAVAARAQQSASAEERTTYHRNRLPEDDARKRHLAFQLNRGLADLFMQYPEAVLFGEDVARKGGVYHVTAELSKRFGVARVFNTLLDETTILGLAMGAGHANLLPFPEVQYLAYLMNAIDQLRGEAGSMQFFSQAQYGNPMVLRIAALAYQKGFGGHFHNDNGIAALLEIPGLLVACPSRGDDAVRMLRTLTATAKELGRPTVFLEPIALYMTKDLHEEGDGEWLTAYPGTEEHLPVGEIGVYEPASGKAQLTILSFANGLWMSLRVAKRLEAQGIYARVVDLRWLSPLPMESILSVVAAGDNVLIVDECRRNSGIADALATRLFMNCPGVRVGLVTGTDTYIPLGAAANLVLVQEEDIEAGVHELLGRS
jgi:2-oxoisovalerate dehydrogenase E1 component